MDDGNRAMELLEVMKSEREGNIGKGKDFSKFQENFEWYLKAWKKSLKCQECKVKKVEQGSDSVENSDYEDKSEQGFDNESSAEDGDIINDKDRSDTEGAYLRFMKTTLCSSWEEAQDKVANELSLNEKQK